LDAAIRESDGAVRPDRFDITPGWETIYDARKARDGPDNFWEVIDAPMAIRRDGITYVHRAAQYDRLASDGTRAFLERAGEGNAAGELKHTIAVVTPDEQRSSQRHRPVQGCCPGPFTNLTGKASLVFANVNNMVDSRLGMWRAGRSSTP